MQGLGSVVCESVCELVLTLLCLSVACCWRAGSRTVRRNVWRQVMHMTFLAASLTFFCDLASPPAAFALRSRFCCALHPHQETTSTTYPKSK
jgi:hypothetical protein